MTDETGGPPPDRDAAPPFVPPAGFPGAPPLARPPLAHAPVAHPAPGQPAADDRTAGQAPGPYAPGPTQWTPPVKPGLIPLRPLDFGTILGAPYQLLRRNPRPTFGVSLLLQGIVLFLTFAIIGIVTFAAFSRVDFASSTADQEEITAGAIGTIVLAALIPVALSIVAAAVMQGVIVIEVARQSLGERLRFRQLFALLRGRIGALLGYTAAITVVVLLVIALVVGVVVALAVTGTPTGIVTGVLLAIGLSLAFAVLFAWLSTKLAFVPSVLVLERATLGGAISRSWQLTNRSFWKIFGILVLVAFILNLATSIAGAPLQLVSLIVPSILTPTGDPTTGVVILIVVTLLSLVLSIVVSALVLVIQSATVALLYIDQRIRKEGLDLELARFVEARQAGRTGVPDPFRVGGGGDAPAATSSPWA